MARSPVDYNRILELADVVLHQNDTIYRKVLELEMTGLRVSVRSSLQRAPRSVAKCAFLSPEGTTVCG